MRKLNLTDMAKRTLKVVVPKIDPPYLNSLNYTRAHQVQVGYGPGIVWQLLRDMANHLNLTFDVELEENEGWGQKLPNGSWTGAFGRLHNGQAEILAGGSMMTPDRNGAFDFTTPIGYQSSGILIRVPKRHNFVARMLVSAFDWKIWLCIVACLILSMIAFCYIQRKLSKCFVERQFCLSDAFMIFFAIFAKQQINSPPRSTAARILIATLWISSVFLMASFGASVISLFAHGTSKLPFETLEELIYLVKKGEWKLVLDMKSTARIEMIEVFTADPLFAQLMADPERVIFVNDLENGIKTVQHYSGNAALVAPSGRLNIMSKLECNVTMLPNHVLPTYLSIAFRKGSPYRHYINKRILDFWQNGLLRRWIQTYSARRYAYPNRHNISKCHENWDDRLRRGIFGLNHFVSIFILFGIGLSFATVVFLFEIITLGQATY